MARHFITRDDRYRIDGLVKDKRSSAEIAKVIGCSERTIWRELQRGCCQMKNRHTLVVYDTYSPQIAQQDYDRKAAAKGPALKIGKDFALVSFLEKQIGELQYAPAPALAEIRLQGLHFDTSISTTTLYRYIKIGVFQHISMKSLPYGEYRIKHRPEGSPHTRHALDKHIGDRPEEANGRQVPGHWEMDTVIGKANKCKCLLVLTDRANHQELAARLYSRSAAEVVKALHRIRRKYPDRQIKTLTCDNGCEFADVAGIEQVAPVYFCHPYSSWERGSNECANKIIRRFLPKGKSMDALTEKQAAYITRWMNHYPRKSLGWQRPEDCMTT